MIEWRGGDWHLALAPATGGALLRCDWQGQAVMRRAAGPGVLDAASFPLVPFSNRIAHGRFEAEGQVVTLAPNMPGSDHPHTLHGFGWLAGWDVLACDAGGVELALAQPAGAWPWSWSARQRFAVEEGALVMALSLTNASDRPMPAGLGFHPYFPRGADTLYHGLHRGEWQTSPLGLPLALDEREAPRDWWQGQPAGRRVVDTVYTGREGPLTLRWPDRGLEASLHPSANLPFTVVFTPEGEDFLCVEPVSHMTDAINHQGRADNGLAWLAPGATLAVECRLVARRL